MLIKSTVMHECEWCTAQSLTYCSCTLAHWWRKSTAICIYILCATFQRYAKKNVSGRQTMWNFYIFYFLLFIRPLISFRKQRHTVKVKVRLHEKEVKPAFCAYMQRQRVECLCVKNSRMKSLSVPCIAEQLAKLDQWQCHSVHTPPGSHTYQLCSVLPHRHGHCHTPFPLSWKHTTQGQRWLILFFLTLQWIFPIV